MGKNRKTGRNLIYLHKCAAYVYACAYVHEYVCVYVYEYVREYVYEYVCVHVCVYVGWPPSAGCKPWQMKV